jgi:DNA-binding GntR family transcriptional regulator
VSDDPGGIVADALDIAPGTDCYEIHRLMFADQQPAVWTVDLFPTSTFVRELTEASVASSPFEMDVNLFVEPIDHAGVQIVPTAAGEELVENLGLAPGQPCIQLREVFYSESGTPLGFSAIHVNDRFVRFELIRRRERS